MSIRSFFDRATKLDSYWSLGQGSWALFCWVSGITGAAVVAWAFSTWEWFWNMYHWAGVAGVAVVTWFLVTLGFFLAAVGAKIFWCLSDRGRQARASEGSTPLPQSENKVVVNPGSLTENNELASIRKARLRRLKSDLNSIFSSCGVEIIKETQTFIGFWGDFQRPSLSASISTLRIDIGEIRVITEEFRQEVFFKFLSYHPTDRSDLEGLIGSGEEVREFIHATDELILSIHNVMLTITNSTQQAAIASALSLTVPQWQQFNEKYQYFMQWLVECNRRLNPGLL